MVNHRTEGHRKHPETFDRQLQLPRPMACSRVRESATDASTAPQSISCWANRPFPSTADALLTPTCSTNLRTSSNERISNGAPAEADPLGRSVSSTRVETPGSDRQPTVLWRPCVRGVCRICVQGALHHLGCLRSNTHCKLFGGFAQSLSGAAEAGSIWFIARSLAGANMELKAPSSLTSSLLTVVKPMIADCSSRAVLVDTNVASCAC